MLKIRDRNLNLLAIVNTDIEPIIRESINREFSFSFATIVDEKKKYIVTGNIVEVDENYFEIVYVRTIHTDSGTFIEVECNHVAYNLNDYDLEAFVDDGTPRAILNRLLSGTGFSSGAVEFSSPLTVAINEETNKRAALIELAKLLDAEILFNKYEISLLQRRGAQRGVQFRLGKNLKGITKHEDRRSGELKVAYDIDIINLEDFSGYRGLEHFELGDTVRIIDREIEVDVSLRIIELEKDTKLKMNNRVVIANFVPDLGDAITQVKRTSLIKDHLYHGVRIGPQFGFATIRSDKKARSIMNSDMIKLQKGDGSGSNWVDKIYMDNDGNAHFAGIITAEGGLIGGWTILSDRLSGSGILQGGKIIGSEIEIGSGNNVFKVGSQGIWAGHANFNSAPFSVNMHGHMKSVGGEFSGDIIGSTITGGSITIGSGNNVFRAGAQGIWAGHSNFNSAPFRVNMQGEMTAMSGTFGGTLQAAGGTFTGTLQGVDGSFSGTITASTFTGGTITGALIQTNASGYPYIALTSTTNFLTASSGPGKTINMEASRGGIPYLAFRDGGVETQLWQSGATFTLGSSDTIVIFPESDLRLTPIFDIELYPLSGNVRVSNWGRFINNATGRSLQQELSSLDARLIALGG